MENDPILFWQSVVAFSLLGVHELLGALWFGAKGYCPQSLRESHDQARWNAANRLTNYFLFNATPITTFIPGAAIKRCALSMKVRSFPPVIPAWFCSL
jgi:hypothetical protein